MPANFPATPAVNDVYSYSGSTWIWTGVYWQLQNSQLINGVSFTYSNTAPSAANLGDRWLNSDTLQELVLVSDGTSTQWVEIASQAPTGATRNLNNLANVAINTSLVPAANVTYDLGSSSLRWRDLYLSGNSLIIGAATITASGSAIALPVGSTVGNTTFGSGSLTTEDLTVSGNLTVNGTTTTINSTTLSIDDKNIVLADGAANSAAADGAGITVAGATATLTYVSASDSWSFNKNILITPGTANGVMYLNASKVATTGSALTFNGTTTLSVSSSLNGASNYIRVINSSNTVNSGALLSIQTGGTSGGTAAIEYYNQTTAIYAGATTSYANYFVGANPDGTTPYFAANSTGLGIGTSSPGVKLTVSYTAAAGNIAHFAGANNVNGYIGAHALSNGGLYINSNQANQDLRLQTQGTDRVILDSSGNLGLGVTPSAWGRFRAIQGGLNGGGSFTVDTLDYQTNVVSNAFFDGTNWRYTASFGAAYYNVSRVGHSWHTAPSGTTGNAITFTQIMALDASGNMSLNGSNYNTASSTGITIADHGNNYDLGSLQGYIKFVGRYWSGDDNIGGAGAMIGAQKGASNGNTGTQLAFYTTEQGASSPNQNSQKMVLTGNGRLGINSTNPGTDRVRIQSVDTDTNGLAVIGINSSAGVSSYNHISLTGNTPNNVVNHRGINFVKTQSLLESIYGISSDITGSYSQQYGFYSKINKNLGASTNGFCFYADLTTNSSGGTAYFYFANDIDASATRFYVLKNGGIGNYSANNVNLSDRREKTNFAPAKSYLDAICAIPVQTFNYIDQSEDDPGLTLGVVAQDVQAVAPELVMESNWGTEDNPKMRLSIYQTDLQYALMKALQELKAEFDAYKAAHP
jgi:hypothetical protein